VPEEWGWGYKAMSELSEYSRISIAEVRALASANSADFEVFLPVSTEEGPVLYRAAGAGLAQPDFERMNTHGVGSLYVRGEDYHRCETALEAKLGAILHNPDVSPEDKAKVVHKVGVSVARDLIDNSAGAMQLERTSNVVGHMIDSVLNDPLIAAVLLDMSEHERSTASHMFVVSTLAVVLGTEIFGPDEATLRCLGFAGMLHDMGKLSISKDILNKITPLTRAETELIHQHPVESVRLIGADRNVTPVMRQMILQHHERIDGRGYPLGLHGSDLLLGSRVLSIVDSFHAMIGHRSYRMPLTPREANRVLETQSGKQFDPELLGIWQDLFARAWTSESSDGAGRPQVKPDELSFRHEHRPALPVPKNLAQRPPRFACRGRTTVQCVYAGRLSEATAAPESFAALTHDVSRGGLCVYAAHPMYRCEVVHVRIRIHREYVWLRAAVAWCRRHDASVYKIGLRFLHRVTEEQVKERCSVKGLAELHTAQTAPEKRQPKSANSPIRQVGEASGSLSDGLPGVNPSSMERESALKTLAALACARRMSEEDQNTVITLSMSGDPAVRLKAAGVLANVGTRSAANALVALLSDRDAEIRAQAATIAGLLKLGDAVVSLRRLLHDPEPHVALRAAGALGRMGYGDGMKLVAETLMREAPENRLAAVALGEITGHRFGASADGVSAARRYLAAGTRLGSGDGVLRH